MCSTEYITYYYVIERVTCHSQHEAAVALTREPLVASGCSSRSRGSLLMPGPQGVQLEALGSENPNQPSL